MKKALKPDYFASLKALKRQKMAQNTGITEDEASYYAMSQTRGWQLFKDLKEELLKELDQMNDTAVSNGATFEELGKNTVVLSLVKGIVNRLVNTVEDIKEECERREGAK